MASSKSNPLWRLIIVIWGDWQTNALWQRIVKYSIAATIALIIAILPQLSDRLTFLVPMTTVFAHPGQRMGLMVESLLMVVFGTLLGLCWSLFGLYLASLVADTNEPAAYTIRALFLLAATLLHGFVRSSSPRLFNFVLFMLVATVLTLELPNEATTAVFNTIYVPVLIGAGVLLLVNFSIFPELSSSYLGSTTIDTLSETMDGMTRATHWFVTAGGDPEMTREEKQSLRMIMSGKSGKSSKSRHSLLKQKKNKKKGPIREFFSDFPNPFHTAGSHAGPAVPVHNTTLANLTDRKAKLRTRLRLCKAAQEEVNFEISISPLPPVDMKPISTHCMSNLVQTVVTLIGACENKFVVLGQYSSTGMDQHNAPTQNNRPAEAREKVDNHFKKVQDAKPIRELEAGSAKLLESILGHVRPPVREFEGSLKEAVALLMSCLAYSFDVPKLPSGAHTPAGIELEEIDIGVDSFLDAVARFDARSAEELKHAAMNETGKSTDLMPRMETFLISSFLLAFRQSAMQILQMLRHARDLVEKRQLRHNRSRIWFPEYTSTRKWLVTGGEFDFMVLPKAARKAVRRGEDANEVPVEVEDSSSMSDQVPTSQSADEESRGRIPDQKKSEKTKKKPKPHAPEPQPTNDGWVGKVRSKAADAMEWAKDSDDLDYALKLSLAVFLVSWPALVTSWNEWYSQVRGLWAPLQLVLVFEVAIGTSLFVFVVRLFGVVFGCLVGFIAYEIARGNRAAMVVILVLGVVPSIYIQVATKYVKAGMISIVSIAVVGLGSVNRSGAAYEIFYKRLVAFLVGGLVAVLVETLIRPVRARDRLVESLSSSIRQIQNMQAAVAVGIDGPERPNFRSAGLHRRFNQACNKAQGALTAAETFLPFCSTEPRLKGSFKPLAPIYGEIIYVLHQIIDRMDNVVQLRKEYGSSILEDLNPKVYAYRRNVAASCTLILFSVNEALNTWLPLPQFIPSARLSQLRLINRVRDILTSQNSRQSKGDLFGIELDEQTAQMITRRKFLSWNASTAGQMEIIEYMEELVELVKLLVGVNAFRSGMLEKPNYRQYMESMETDEVSLEKVHPDQTGASRTHEASEIAPAAAAEEGVTPAAQQPELEGNDSESEEEEEFIPRSLQRVGTRLFQDNAVVHRKGFPMVGRRS